MITDVRVQNFRIYKDEAFEFTNSVNIIVGPNGSGKTTLLEAIELSCRGKSHKGQDADMLGHNNPWFRVETHIEDSQRVVKFQEDQKSFSIDGKDFKRLPVGLKVPVVIFEPTHLQLLTESPSKRRDFIDDIIEQTDLSFAKTRRDYKRVLAQRNTLLKTRPSEEQLFIWDIRLSEFGAIIHRARKNFIDSNKNLLEDLYKKISKRTDVVSLRLDTINTNKDYTAGMMKLLKERRHTDSLRGFTTIGPHRDDVLPLINGHELSRTGSRGEIRTTLLSMKVLELKALEKSIDKKPILLLDDVFSELDGSRRRALTSYLKDHQTFITTTDADVVVHHFMNNSHIIPLS